MSIVTEETSNTKTTTPKKTTTRQALGRDGRQKRVVERLKEQSWKLYWQKQRQEWEIKARHVVDGKLPDYYSGDWDEDELRCIMGSHYLPIQCLAKASTTIHTHTKQ
jgi:hypothetical protein